jgi:aminoglycoside phosphotransferase family enzyme/predicted kinase
MPALAPRPLPYQLLRPEAWPTPGSRAPELIETHVSWVFRSEHEVIKVKKPVNLGFLDFRSPEARRLACEDEVRLNARLAPGTYLGTVPIVQGADGLLKIGGEGRVVDWGVHMRRLADELRADAMLARGTLATSQIDELAEAIARFHSGATVPEDTAVLWASPEAVARNVTENFAQTRALGECFVTESYLDSIESWQSTFLHEHAHLFAKRASAGRARDGHGDLRLEHVYFEKAGLRIIDCIEFDERYRVADVCADVAFLSMDLAAHGRVDLAERFLARYARATDDYELYELADFYEGYRACVRGKVAAILANDAQAPEDLQRQAASEARRHFVLALAGTREWLVAPALICVGGLIASGKSTVAEALGEALSCPVVDADRTRKRMLKVEETRPLHDPAWQGAYDPGVTLRVYAEVLSRAASVLASGRSVVVDASFRSHSLREGARQLAKVRDIRLQFVECRAPVEVCRARLAHRHGGPSDGRLAIFDEFAARFEPVDEFSAGEHIVLDTSRDLAASLAELREKVSTWPAALVA